MSEQLFYSAFGDFKNLTKNTNKLSMSEDRIIQSVKGISSALIETKYYVNNNNNNNQSYKLFDSNYNTQPNIGRTNYNKVGIYDGNMTTYYKECINTPVSGHTIELTMSFNPDVTPYKGQNMVIEGNNVNIFGPVIKGFHIVQNTNVDISERNPLDLVILGSNDKNEWYKLLSVNNINWSNNPTYFELSKPVSFKHYRFVNTRFNSSNHGQTISEILLETIPINYTNK